ncbi:uncharacterized protein LOC123667993 [Melitaea cinxia]|uniref:uncharacterized protein LOC123667993 n=1 Tax=Melitaea cinxia TaxID=113334 RepID=UPI001E273150|nr:uncharacterized protein LOC123667993 [Melitaea cinxia]
MAPAKFGLFKTRSRDHPEQPSTENLLQSSQSNDNVNTPDSPVPSTSKGIMGNDDFFSSDIFSLLNLDDDDDEVKSRAASLSSKIEEQKIAYENLQNQSTGTSTVTLEDDDQVYDQPESTLTFDDDASTSYDANSLQFDETSITASNDDSLYCSMLKKPKKSKSKDQQLTDLDMWQASNIEVMENLLNRSGSLDEQIKWEAIATARGLCTLTDSCTCPDCTGVTYLAGVTDGDGGLGVAPILSAINVGCQVQ